MPKSRTLRRERVRKGWEFDWEVMGKQRQFSLPVYAGVRDPILEKLRTNVTSYIEGRGRNPPQIIDLGCGRGVPTIVAKNALDKAGIGGRVLGIDYANTTEYLAREGVEYKTASMEKIPIEDGKADGIISAFGFDYSDKAKTVREIRRVLRPKGRVVLLLHSRESAFIADTRKELANRQAVALFLKQAREYALKRDAKYLRNMKRVYEKMKAEDRQHWNRLYEEPEQVLSNPKAIGALDVLIDELDARISRSGASVRKRTSFESLDKAKEFFERRGFKVLNAEEIDIRGRDSTTFSLVLEVLPSDWKRQQKEITGPSTAKRKSRLSWIGRLFK